MCVCGVCVCLLESEGLGSGIKELISGDDPVTEEMLLRIQNINDSSRIVLGRYGEHVQLVEFRDLLQELPDVWSEATVVDYRLAPQSESIHILCECACLVCVCEQVTKREGP